MPLSESARALLAHLLESQRTDPREPFVIARMNAPDVLVHHLGNMHEMVSPRPLLELEEARLFIQNSRDKDGRLKSFFVIDDRGEAALKNAEEEAEAAKARAVARRVDLRGLLEAMIAAERTRPGLFFTVSDMREGPMIGHEAIPKPGLLVERATLIRLTGSGAVEQGRHGFGELYLLPRAAEILEHERRLQGDSHEQELEDRLAASAARDEVREKMRRRSARRFGRLVRWIVLPLILVLIGVVAWIVVGSTGAAVVIGLAIGWEVLTSGFGISGASVAAAAERRAAAWAERQLARWNAEGSR